MILSPLSPEITLTVWAGVKESSHGATRTQTWLALAEEYTALGNQIRAKSLMQAPSFCTVRDECTPDECSISSKSGASIVRHRCKKAVLSVTALVFDYDSKAVEWSVVTPILDAFGLAYLVHDSPSHKDIAPKWRLYIPLSQPWADVQGWGEAYKRIKAEFETLLKLDFDKQTSDPCRVFYPPTRPTPADAPRIVKWHDGQALNLRLSLRDPEAIHAPSPRVATHLDRARAYLSKMDPSIQGSDGSGALLRAAQSMARGFELSERDAVHLLMSEFNPRCLPPWSETEVLHKVKSTLDGGSMPFGELLNSSKPETTQSVPSMPSKLPIVVVTSNQKTTVIQALDAIRGHKNIFQRQHVLVQIMSDSSTARKIDRPVGAPIVREIPQSWLTAELSDRADWGRYKDGELVQTCVPPWCSRLALDLGEWNQFEHLVGVTETPMLRADGSVLEVPGYDRVTGMFYAPNAKYPAVPQAPTQNDAMIALFSILELVKDFPFASPAHKSAWLAGLLTPFTRAAFVGCTPIFLADANTPGSGKTLLINVIGIIYTGRDFSRCPQTDDPEEERKRITTMAMEGDRMALFDNVTRVGGPVFDAALTSINWKERQLGVSKSTGELPLLIGWYATGNNVQLIGDISRRICHIRLESPEEKPEDRKDFQIKDLETHVREHRAELASACLLILKAYFVAGKPKHGLASWGGFEPWSAIVRECLVWLGLPDCADTRRELNETADLATDSIGDFLRGWKQVCDANELTGVSTSTMQSLLEQAPERYQPMRAAIAELGPPKRSFGGPTARELGMILRTVKGRTVEGLRINSRKTMTARLWSVSTAGSDHGRWPVMVDCIPATQKQTDFISDQKSARTRSAREGNIDHASTIGHAGAVTFVYPDGAE